MIEIYRKLMNLIKLVKIPAHDIVYLETLLGRYGYSDMELVVENRYSLVDRILKKKIIKYKRKFPCGTHEKKCEKNLKIILSSDEAAEYDKYLTTQDVISILSAKEKIDSELPEIFNTMENIYQKIILVGHNEYADYLAEYFEKNPNIYFEHREIQKFKLIDDVYYTEDAKPEESIYIFADFYRERSLYNNDGKKLQTLYVCKIYREELKTTDYLNDMNEYIVPRLVENGIGVLKVYIPDEKKLVHYKKIRRKQIYWKIVRKINENYFWKKREHNTNTEYLKEEKQNLVNDNTKGYSIVYGNGQYINFTNGFRETVGNSIGINNSIYFFGPCFIRGIEVEDKNTIPSLLKKKIGQRYNVYNYGSEFHTCNYIMRTLDYKQGDIVVIFSSEKKENEVKENKKVKYLDLTETYNKIGDLQKHVYDMLEHFDFTVEKQIVDDVYELLEKNGFLRSSNSLVNKTISFGSEQKRIPDIVFCKDKNFIKWISELKEEYLFAGKVGAIVMNCNPFTNGHRYLIETVAKKVEHLFIFVVQEDKSIFPYKDRMMLVKEGTSDLINVHVVPSGNYMISSMTLPGYFQKEQLSDTVLDASTDLLLFLQIAKELNISVRFAGEEPLDPFTRQYNENMEKFLPKYGVEFEVIKRKEENGAVISASRVRQALKDGKYDEIKKLVPDTTYEYLVKRYKKTMGVES